jgi:hypothetical protein
MGDRKPSQILHLKWLTPDVPDAFLRRIWASRRPRHMEAILAAQTEGSLNSASHLAYRICEVAPHPTNAGTFEVAPLSVSRHPHLMTSVDCLGASRTLPARWQHYISLMAGRPQPFFTLKRPTSQYHHSKLAQPARNVLVQSLFWRQCTKGQSTTFSSTGNLHQQPLTAANDCSTPTPSRLFVTDRLR